MIKNIIIFLLFALTAGAYEFQPAKVRSEKINCKNKNKMIYFANLKQPYLIYDKNSSSIKLINCEKIQIEDLNFYTVLFSSEIHEGENTQKILTFEVALMNKKLNSVQTVRSEIVDQIELSGDLPNTDFDSAIKTEWGRSKNDNTVMLKFEINTKNEKPFSYLLKLNSKLSWFEDLMNVKSKKENIKKN